VKLHFLAHLYESSWLYERARWYSCFNFADVLYTCTAYTSLHSCPTSVHEPTINNVFGFTADINDLLLVLLWTYIIKKRKKLMTEEELSKTNIRYLYSRLAVIPCLYVMSILIAFLGNIRLAVIFPVIIVPPMILLSRVFGSEKWMKKNTTHL
jgi:L-asparagine transporter-like permease